MFRHIKNYIRPAATTPNGGSHGAPSSAQPFPLEWGKQPAGDPGKIDGQRISQMRADISLELMARTQQANMWISPTPPPGEGVILKVAPGEFISRPKTLKQTNDPFYRAGVELNAKVSSFRFQAEATHYVLNSDPGYDQYQGQSCHLFVEP